MNFKKLFSRALYMIPMTMLLCSFSSGKEAGNYRLTHVAIIPQPQSITYGDRNVKIKSVHKNLDTSLAEEAYGIDVREDGIHLSYATEKGLKWGEQTLKQILLQQKEVDGVKTIPMLSIKDAPKYAWRSFHLDVARHMYSLSFLKKLIDCLSFYKINHLHLHLTDDQGWRLEIKKYPELIKAGAWRTFDRYDRQCLRMLQRDKEFYIDPQFVRNGNEYGGYYTQKQMKDLVKYAMDKGVDVIPEIDMPGHLTAAIKCHPEMQCNGTTGWGKEFSFPICAGRDENYQILKDILDEVMQIFPGKYIHIGADEVNKDPWEKCEKCQAKMREHNLKNVEELCNWFVRQISDYVKSKGRTVMTWDDAYYANDPNDVIYTYWRDWLPESPAVITKNGKDMIFMEWGHFYFSGRPSDRQLEALYNYDIDKLFPGINHSKMLGYQACVWSETIPNESILGRHVFPSLQAFSELIWSKERNWDSFLCRLPWHIHWLRENGITVRRSQHE